MRADVAGMARLGIDPASPRGQRIAQCGFEIYRREDGIYLSTGDQSRHFAGHYNRWLSEHGYDGDNPWANWANAVDTPDGPMSGWYLDASPFPARVRAEHSETAYLTDQAIACIDSADDAPWCIHL